jgi:hypothetical protein
MDSTVGEHMKLTSSIHRITSSVLLALVLGASPNALRAQFKTPVVDGVIKPGEYGNTESGTNQYDNAGNTGQTWYMTWDATNLYVGIANANLNEGAVIYIDSNPIFPVTGGTNTNGNLTGFNYDNTNFSVLPFRSQFVTYFKTNYREYRTSDSAGNWTSATANAGSYADSSGPLSRELSVPWDSITSGHGRPSSFLFFGYLTSSGGYVYGQAPTSNPGGFIGTSAAYPQYFEVEATEDGSSTPPFFFEPPYPASGNIISKSGPSNARVWTLQITNHGPASLSPVIDNFTLVQTSGAACTPVVLPTFPETIANIPPGQSKTGTVTLDFTECALNARFTAAFHFDTFYGPPASVIRTNQFQ